MRMYPAKTQKGFTLIEIIAALAIIGLGLVGILSLFPVGIDASRRAGDMTNATVLGQSIFNQIRSAAKKGDMSLGEAKSRFETSVPKDFPKDINDQKKQRDDGIIPIEGSYIPEVEATGQKATLYQYQIRFDDPPKEEKLDDLARVGLQKVTVTVSWPATEPEVALRNRITLVTFIRFPEFR